MKDLEINDEKIIEVVTGYTSVLRTEGGYEISIEVPFLLDTLTAKLEVVPEPVDVSLTPLAGLLQQRISSAIADKRGGLTLSFENGTRLRVEPHGTFEPWTLAGPRGQKVVSLPGGELAIWSATDV